MRVSIFRVCLGQFRNGLPLGIAPDLVNPTPGVIVRPPPSAASRPSIAQGQPGSPRDGTEQQFGTGFARVLGIRASPVRSIESD